MVAQKVKNLPAVQEIWIPSLGQEDSPEKGMATHSSILAWKIPWMEEPGKLQSMGLQSWTGLSDFILNMTEVYVSFIQMKSGDKQSRNSI